MSGQPYVYVLVRTDLAPAHQMVQASHAAWQAGAAYKAQALVPNLVLLAVAGQDELLAVADKLAGHGVAHELFFEPDGDVGYSALATEPLFARRERALFAGYPLAQGG